MTIAAFYLAICIASICVALQVTAPESTGLVYVAAIAVATVGVPHGGLDHWIGRRLLVPYSPQRWWIMFFPAYLTIAIIFAAGWLIAPVFTVVLFFLLSAWHFGREDAKAGLTGTSSKTPMAHLAAIAVGGLILWVPALARGDEMLSLLRIIVPATDPTVPQAIVTITQVLAMLLVPIAFGVIVSRIANRLGNMNHWMPLATIGLAATTPILLSFTIYFCCWHSLHGLQRLQREEGLSNLQFLKSVAPLSILAVTGIALAGWYFHEVTVGLAAREIAQRRGTLQSLFIGLSAIAVPHLLLNELSDFISAHQSKPLRADRQSAIAEHNPTAQKLSGELTS